MHANRHLGSLTGLGAHREQSHGRTDGQKPPYFYYNIDRWNVAYAYANIQNCVNVRLVIILLTGLAASTANSANSAQL